MGLSLSYARARLEEGTASADAQWLSVEKISRAWLMSMSISAVVLCEDVFFAGVAAVLETPGQVAGVGACLSHEGLTPSAVLRSLSLDEKPMRVCVLAMRLIDNVSDKQMQLTYLEGFAAKNAVMRIGDSEHRRRRE